MTKRIRTTLCVLAGLGLCSSGASAKPKTYVDVPSVAWESLVPYVRANLVAELEGNSFNVSVCPKQIGKSMPKPFDDALSDFSCVLITEAMRRDEGIEAAITSAMASFRRRVPELTADERKVFREMFWDTLARSPYFLPKLQERLAKAREDKKIRCSLCEKNPGFAPHARRVGKP